MNKAWTALPEEDKKTYNAQASTVEKPNFSSLSQQSQSSAVRRMREKIEKIVSTKTLFFKELMRQLSTWNVPKNVIKLKYSGT